MIRQGYILAVAALLSACATAHPAPQRTAAAAPAPEPAREAPTPMDRYRLETDTAPEQIALGQHAEGLSERQRAALADYARGYIEAGGEKVTIRTPAGAGDAATHMAEAARAALESAGLHDHEVALDTYPADKPDAPILLSYDRLRVKPIACGRNWSNFTSSAGNQVQRNFGCAETANLAAQIADPRDVQQAHAVDPSDGGRRAVVLDKYRKGEITASQSDDKMKGNISQAVQ